ncbi:hypothetical protein Tco_0442827 [Tanacetum coccineum]
MGMELHSKAKEKQASSSGTQADKAPFYDSDGSAEVHQYEFFYNNKIFNMFTQEEQYTKLPEFTIVPHLDQQNESNVIPTDPNMEHTGGTVEQHPKQIKSVYQEQCLTKKINALHLSSAKTITTLNEEIANLNTQLSKEKSNVSYLEHKREKLKSDFKTREDELLDKLIQCMHVPLVVYDSEGHTANLLKYKKCEECKYDKISYDKAYNEMQHQIERLQAQLGDLKEKMKGTSVNTKFAKPSILGKPPLQSFRNQSVVRQSTAFQSEQPKFPNIRFIPKVIEIIDVTKPVTSHSVPKTQELKVVKHKKKNQKKHKPKVKKSKKSGFKERLALPRSRKPRSCLMWSPTGRIFDLSGKIIDSSDSECYQNLFMVHRLGLLQAYDRESEAAHQLCLEVYGNCSLWE